MDEVKILARAKQGDKAARREIMTRYLPMVQAQARAVRRRVRALEYDELVSEGCIGIDAAIRAFDASRGGTLGPIARQYVRRTMIESAWDANGPVRVPRRAPNEVKARARSCADDVDTSALACESPSPEQAAMYGEVCDAVEELPKPRSVEVIKGRVAGRFLDEIGADYDICRERVRQIESDAMSFLTRRLGVIP